MVANLTITTMNDYFGDPAGDVIAASMPPISYFIIIMAAPILQRVNEPY